MEEQNGDQNVSASGSPTTPPSTPEQLYYTATVPVEKTSKHPGRVEGVFSIICATTALLFFPVIFGPVGIVLGVQARKKGEKTLGLVGIILSSVLMAAGFILGFLTGLEEQKSLEGAGGFILHVLNR